MFQSLNCFGIFEHDAHNIGLSCSILSTTDAKLNSSIVQCVVVDACCSNLLNNLSSRIIIKFKLRFSAESREESRVDEGFESSPEMKIFLSRELSKRDYNF